MSEEKVINKDLEKKEVLEEKESEKSVLDSTLSDVSKSKAKSTTVPKNKKKKSSSKFIKKGAAHVLATYNNTIITFTDVNGNVIAWSSAGKCGFKGPKKATPFAASIIVEDAANRAKERGLEEIVVYVKGVGLGRDSAVRALNTNGFTITNIKDITPTPHNGCRKRKPRRV
ncbi:30S ribosomal protein S11 [Patescibacteria group bacterium]|nr:30S ribosomal protein S11 [Patescibacteria group bacterium]